MDRHFEVDVVFAQIAGGQMDEYVHTEVLFYPIGSVRGMTLPQLTIGTWLETAGRLRAVRGSLPGDQIEIVDQARAEVQRVRSVWPALYQHKAHREVKSRLDSWTWYLDDLLSKDAPLAPQASGYMSQIHIRFKLELLCHDVAQPSDSLSRLQLADRRLRARFVPGAFIWDAALEPAAPRDTFWFLFGLPM